MGDVQPQSEHAFLSSRARLLSSIVEVKDRGTMMNSYKTCFTGKCAIEAILSNESFGLSTRDEAVSLCQKLFSGRYFVKAQPSDRKAISEVTAIKIDSRDVFYDSPDAFYQFTTLMHQDLAVESVSRFETMSRRNSSVNLMGPSPSPVDGRRRSSLPSTLSRLPSQRCLTPMLSRSASSLSLSSLSNAVTPLASTPSNSQLLHPATGSISPPPLKTQSSAVNFLQMRQQADDATRSRAELASQVHTHQALLKQTAKEVSRRGADLTLAAPRGRDGGEGVSSPSPSMPTHKRERSISRLESVNALGEGILARSHEMRSDISILRRGPASRRGSLAGGQVVAADMSDSSSSDDEDASTAAPSSANGDRARFMAPYDNYSGWLHKKQVKSMGPISSKYEQERYFRLEVASRCLAYYMSEQDVFPLGFIDLADITAVSPVTEKRDGTRFNIVTPSRVFPLRAKTNMEATQWIVYLTDALADLKQCAGPFQRKPALHTSGGDNAFPLPAELELYLDTAHNKAGAARARRPSISMAITSNSGIATYSAETKTPAVLTVARGSEHVVAFRRARVDEHAFALSPLRLYFYQLNYSLSTVGQRDHFAALLARYPDDDSVLACIADALQSSEDATQGDLASVTSTSTDVPPSLFPADMRVHSHLPSHSPQPSPTSVRSDSLPPVPPVPSLPVDDEETALTTDSTSPSSLPILPVLRPQRRRALSATPAELLPLLAPDAPLEAPVCAVLPCATPSARAAIGACGSVGIHDACAWKGTEVAGFVGRHRRSRSDVGLTSMHYIACSDTTATSSDAENTSTSTSASMCDDYVWVAPGGAVTFPPSPPEKHTRTASGNGSNHRASSSSESALQQFALLALHPHSGASSDTPAAPAGAVQLVRYETPARELRMQTQRMALLRACATVAAKELGELPVTQRVRHWAADPSFLSALTDRHVVCSELRLALPTAWAAVMRKLHQDDENDDVDMYSEDDEHEYSRSRSVSTAFSALTSFTQDFASYKSPSASPPASVVGTPTALQPHKRTIVHLVTHMHSSKAPPSALVQALISRKHVTVAAFPTLAALPEAAERLIRPHKRILGTEPPSVSARELVAWLMWQSYVDNSTSAVEFARALTHWGILRCVSGDPRRNFKSNSARYVVRDVSQLTEVLDHFPVAPVAAFSAALPAGAGTPSLSLLGSLDSSLMTIRGNNPLAAQVTAERAGSRVTQSWLATVPLVTLLTGLSTDHWHRVWVGSCRSCQRAAQVFLTLVSHHCAPMPYSPDMAGHVDIGLPFQAMMAPLQELCVLNALLAVLTTPIATPQAVPRIDVWSPRYPEAVCNAGAWRAVLGAIYCSHFHVRRVVLTQINTLLSFSSQGSQNLATLIAQPGWADWVLALLDDVADEKAFLNNLPYDVLYQRLSNGVTVGAMVPADALCEPQHLISYVYQMTMHIVVLGLIEAFSLDNSERAGVAEHCLSPTPAAGALHSATSQFALAACNVDTKLYPRDFNPHLNINNLAVCGEHVSYANLHEHYVACQQSKAQPFDALASLLPFYDNGFLLPLSRLARGSAERPFCFRSQLRDVILIALSRSHSTNYTLPRAILLACVAKIQRISTNRRNFGVPMHQRLEQIAYMLDMIKSFIFSVTLRSDITATEDTPERPTPKKTTKAEEEPAAYQLGIPGFAFILGANEDQLAAANGDMSLAEPATRLGEAPSYPSEAAHLPPGIPNWVLRGGCLHWRERYGIDHDIELLERTVGMLHHMKLIELPTDAGLSIFAPATQQAGGMGSGQHAGGAVSSFSNPAAAASVFASRRANMARFGTMGASAFVQPRAHPSSSAPVSSSKTGVSADGTIIKPSPAEVWQSLAGHSQSNDAALSPQAVRCIKYIQNTAQFLKESIPFLLLMKERVYLLTETQISALVREFIGLEKRQKIFTSKLTL